MPSHHFPPNLLDTSCLCKRFVVFDISVLLLQLRGVWRLHNFASQESTSGSVISVTLSRNGSSVGAKVSHKPACLQVVHVFLDPGNKKKKKKHSTECDTLCSVCPRPARPPTQTVFLSQARMGNNANKAGPFSVRDAVNIF